MDIKKMTEIERGLAMSTRRLLTGEIADFDESVDAVRAVIREIEDDLITVKDAIASASANGDTIACEDLLRSLRRNRAVAGLARKHLSELAQRACRLGFPQE